MSHSFDRSQRRKKIIAVITAVTLIISLSLLALQNSEKSGEYTNDSLPTEQKKKFLKVVSTIKKPYSGKDLKELFFKSSHVIAGEISKITHFRGGTPQTTWHFKDGSGKLLRNNAQSSQKVWTYDNVMNKNVGTLKTGKSYVFFMSGHLRPAAVFESNDALIQTLKNWQKEGYHSREELKQIAQKADWIVHVKFREEICMESSPCGHEWSFNVVKVVKGKNVPSKIIVSGSYGGEHKDGIFIDEHSTKIPVTLKGLRGRQYYTLYLSTNTLKSGQFLSDVSVLASVKAIFTQGQIEKFEESVKAQDQKDSDERQRHESIDSQPIIKVREGK